MDKIAFILKKFSAFIAVLLLISGVESFSQTKIDQDTVSGRWSKENSPYIIYSDVRIPYGEKLVIDPGVEVQFSGFFCFRIEGIIIAEGNISDSIIFTSTNDTKNWHGLRFESLNYGIENTESSILSYCVIENSSAVTASDWNLDQENRGGAISLPGKHRLVLRNCLMQNNVAKAEGGAIWAFGSLKSYNSTFTNNRAERGGAIYFENYKNDPLTVIGSLFTNNSAKMYSALYSSTSNSNIINCTFSDNLTQNENGFIMLLRGGRLVNTIVYYNQSNLIFVSNAIEILNCCIEYGKNSLIEYNELTQIDYRSCLESAPMFADRFNGNYRLGISPCINAGIETSLSGNYLSDIDGNPRVFQEMNSKIDMGAYEYQDTIPNRLPQFIRKRDYYLLKNQNNLLRVYYEEQDQSDEVLFTVDQGNEELAAEIVETSDSWILISVYPAIDNDTIITLYVSASDANEYQNNTINDSINLIISNKFKGLINTFSVFKDSMEIIGDISIQDGGELKILPGSYLNFSGCYKISSYGPIEAIGEAGNEITFNCSDSSIVQDNNRTFDKGWGGIDLIGLNDSIIFSYCNFRNTGVKNIPNQSINSYGVINILNSSNIYFSNCDFVSNAHYYDIGNAGIYSMNSTDIEIKHCRFFDGYINPNGTENAGTYVHALDSKLIIDSSEFHNSRAGNYKSLYFGNSDGKISNSFFHDLKDVCAIQVGGGNIWVENCFFINNHRAIELYGTSSLVRNNVFINNGRAIKCSFDSPKIVNNLFAHNSIICNCSNFSAVGVLIEHGTPYVLNNTFIKNTQDYNGNVLYYSYASPFIHNNLFWGNSKEGIGGYNGAGLNIQDPSISHNIILNEVIVDQFNQSDSLDFSLTDHSIGIDDGLMTENIVNLFPELDLNGDIRIDTISGIVDVGAYEYQGEFHNFDPVIDTTLIINDFFDQSVLIYPNPASEIIIIKDFYKEFQFSIYDINGSVVQTGVSDNGMIQIEALKPSVYFLKGRKENHTLKGYFIKK